MKKKLKYLLNITFYILMILLIIYLFKNNTDFNYNVNINNKKTYEKYKNYKYVTIDLKDANLNRLALDLDNKNYYIYSKKKGDKYVLVYLNKNTALTKKVNVIKYNDDEVSNEIKSSLISDEDDNISYYKGYYSNIDYSKNKKLLDIKYYVSYAFIGALLLLILFNIFLMVTKKN